MTTPLIGSNISVELQKTLAATTTITAITLANPGVVTDVAHGYSNGDVVLLSIAGTVQLDKVACRIANKATDTYELEGIDTTTFGTFVSGTAAKVTAWDTVGWATTVNVPNASPAEINCTTLADRAEQVVYGMPGAAKGTMDGLFQIGDVAMANLRAATAANATRVFRITWPGGQKCIMNCNVAAGSGFSQGVNAAATTSCAVTVRGFPNFYAS